MAIAGGGEPIEVLDYPVYAYGIGESEEIYESHESHGNEEKDQSNEGNESGAGGEREGRARGGELAGGAVRPHQRMAFPDTAGLLDGFAGDALVVAPRLRKQLAEAKQRIAALEGELEDLRSGSRAALLDAEGEGKRRAEEAAQQARREADARHQAAIARTVADFAGEREEYFRKVEAEVVRLALAIAARVLYRESQMDPLLLRGAVHAALERLTEKGGTVLHVCAGDLPQWQAYFSAHRESPAAAVALERAADLAPGECRLTTSMGTIELGVAAQLEEIERGFFDLLDCRPGERRLIEANAELRRAAQPGPR